MPAWHQCAQAAEAGRAMRIGSLFSGGGGLDLADEHVFGGRVVWHCENDPAASKVLAHRWPGVPNLHDITTVDWTQVEPVDVLCGGFPCQDISSAGKQAGMGAGTRSGLWSDFARAIDALRPRWVVIENVGICSVSKHYARWNPQRMVWETETLSLFCEDSEPFSETWPTSGSMRTGAVYPLQRSGPATSGGGFSLLPSPKSSARSSRQAMTQKHWSAPGLEQAIEIAQGILPREFDSWAEVPGASGLLPTPCATDGTKGGPNQRGSSGDLMLSSAVLDL